MATRCGRKPSRRAARARGLRGCPSPRPRSWNLVGGPPPPPVTMPCGILLLHPPACPGFLLGEWTWCGLTCGPGAAWTGLGLSSWQLGGLSLLTLDSASCRAWASGRAQGGLCGRSRRPRSGGHRGARQRALCFLCAVLLACTAALGGQPGSAHRRPGGSERPAGPLRAGARNGLWWTHGLCSPAPAHRLASKEHGRPWHRGPLFRQVCPPRQRGRMCTRSCWRTSPTGASWS